MMFFKGYYHGDFQWAQKADYPGILPEEVENNVVVPWFDMDAMQKAYDEANGDFAGLIAQPYDHGNFFDNKTATKEQWAKVRKFCDDHGMVLIIDDVRTGFRLDLAGSDHYYGFKADLICFCKALANGYNMSAVCGQEHMKNTASSVVYTGSYWMSAEPFAACLACIPKMKRLDTPKMFRERVLNFVTVLLPQVRSTVLILKFPVNPHFSIFVSLTMTALCFIRSGLRNV